MTALEVTAEPAPETQNRPVTPAEISAAVDAWHFTREMTPAEVAEWAPRLAYTLRCADEHTPAYFAALADGLYDHEHGGHHDRCEEGGERAYVALSEILREIREDGDPS